MARAPHTRAPDARRDGRDDAPAEPAPSPAVAHVLWLQSASGNRAVANQLARAPASAPTGLPDKAPSSAPSLPGQTKVVAGPPPTGVEEGPHPGADLSAGTHTVTLTFVIRDLHLKGRHPSSIDWLHEPGVEVEASRDDISKPALSAAISAMNAHIRGRGEDIAEVALGAKAGVEHDGTPTAGAELKAQIKVSTTFSITVGTSLGATPGGEGEQDPGKIPIMPHGAGVKLEWTPMSIGVQFKLDKEKEPDRPGVVDYSEDMEDGKADAWAAGQLSAAELGQFDALATVEKLHDAMRAAKGDEAHWTMHLGPRRESEIPAGITRTLTRAAQLLVQAKPSLARLRSVRVTMVRDDEAEKRETAVRYLVLPLGSVTVASSPVAAAAPPLRTRGAPDGRRSRATRARGLAAGRAPARSASRAQVHIHG